MVVNWSYCSKHKIRYLQDECYRCENERGYDLLRHYNERADLEKQA